MIKRSLSLAGALLSAFLVAAGPAAAQLLPDSHADPRDPAIGGSLITLTGSVTSWDGGGVRSSADGSSAKLCLVFNNLNAPGQELPVVAPAAWAYLFLPPGLTVDARYTPAGVYTAPVGGWTLLYVFQPALPPCGGHQWTIPLLSDADEPGEMLTFRHRGRVWRLLPGPKDVSPFPTF